MSSSNQQQNKPADWDVNRFQGLFSAKLTEIQPGQFLMDYSSNAENTRTSCLGCLGCSGGMALFCTLPELQLLFTFLNEPDNHNGWPYVFWLSIVLAVLVYAGTRFNDVMVLEPEARRLLFGRLVGDSLKVHRIYQAGELRCLSVDGNYVSGSGSTFGGGRKGHWQYCPVLVTLRGKIVRIGDWTRHSLAVQRAEAFAELFAVNCETRSSEDSYLYAKGRGHALELHRGSIGRIFRRGLA